MSKSKFKVGDKVRVNHTTEWYREGAVGVILLISAAVLLQEEGILFIIGFCFLALGLTNLYIMARVISK
ncbi:MAG: hypothetical protein V1703_00215 [Candidatus Altiarchaeota archaeon]